MLNVLKTSLKKDSNFFLHCTRYEFKLNCYEKYKHTFPQQTAQFEVSAKKSLNL